MLSLQGELPEMLLGEDSLMFDLLEPERSKRSLIIIGPEGRTTIKCCSAS